MTRLAGWRIHFWEPTLSPHKLALFRALATDPRVLSCTYVSQQGLSAERRAQGWAVDGLDGLDIRVAPDAAEIDTLMAGAAGRDAVHLFSGIHAPPLVAVGIAAALRHGARFGLMSEPRASEGARGVVRLAHSWASEGQLRRQAAFVLAIGRGGPPWFRRAGYSSDRIFPFAYFVQGPALFAAPTRADNRVRLGYLGRLVEAKGIRLLLDALPLLPPAVDVIVAGHGAEAPRVEAAAAASHGRLRFAGALPMAKVPAFLAGLDLLVQPSLTSDDGWGAVVSEALLAGTAAIATAKVGASILLDTAGRGAVMARPDPRLLADAVSAQIAAARFDAPHRAARQAWAESRLTGDAGAAHLLAIFAHLFAGAPRPPPFYA